MAYLNGLTIDADMSVLKLADGKAFMDALYAHAEKFLLAAPYGSSLRVEVQRIGAGYKVIVRLASLALQLLENAEAKSPFVALEKCLLKAHDTVQVWSMNKTV